MTKPDKNFSGGTLLISSSSGIFDTNMRRLTQEDWLRRWHIPALGAKEDYVQSVYGQGKIVLVSSHFMQIPISDQCRVPHGTSAVYSRTCSADFPQIYGEAARFRDFLEKVCPEAIILELQGLQEQVTAALHRNRKGHFVLQLVNTQGTGRVQANDIVSHSDAVLFPELGAGKVILKSLAPQVKSVKMTALDASQDVDMIYSQSGEELSIDIPAKSFRCYALIKIEI